MSSNGIDRVDEYRYIAVDQIRLSQNDNRTPLELGDLEGLAETIREHGIIQPIIVFEYEPKLFEVIAGGRRLRAAKIAGDGMVPCIVRSVSSDEIKFIENDQREPCSPIAEAKYVYERVYHGVKIETIARTIGRSEHHVRRRLQLNRLGPSLLASLGNREFGIDFYEGAAVLDIEGQSEILTAARSTWGPKTYSEVMAWIGQKGILLHEIYWGLSESVGDLPICKTCVYCVGGGLFDDERICMNRSCFAQKMARTVEPGSVLPVIGRGGDISWKGRTPTNHGGKKAIDIEQSVPAVVEFIESESEESWRPRILKTESFTIRVNAPQSGHIAELLKELANAVGRADWTPT